MSVTTELFKQDGGPNIEASKQDVFEIVEQIRDEAPDIMHRLEDVANEYANKRIIDFAVREYGDEIADKTGKVAGIDPQIAEKGLREAELELTRVGKELENYFASSNGTDDELARSRANLVVIEIKKEASGLIFDLKSRRSEETVDIDPTTNEPKDVNLDPGNPAVVVGKTSTLVKVSPETIAVLNAIDEAIREKDTAANQVDEPEKKLGFWGRVKELVGLGDNDEQRKDSNLNETALIAEKTVEHEEALKRIADKVSGEEKEEDPKNLLGQFKKSMKEAKLRFETLAAEVFVEPVKEMADRAKEMAHDFEHAVRGLQDVKAHEGNSHEVTPTPVFDGAFKSTERSGPP